MLKKVIGILLIVAGVVSFFISQYISGQVEQGKQKISKAQQQVDTGNKILSLSPTAQQFGGGLTKSAQKKINAGSQQAAEYEALAKKLTIAAIVLALSGVIVLVYPTKKRG